MSRYVSLLNVLLLTLLLAPSDELHAGDARPNIVLIISDDQGAGDYGFMGHPQLQTPHLDKLAKESLCFRRGFVPTSVCCPSLANHHWTLSASIALQPMIRRCRQV